MFNSDGIYGNDIDSGIYFETLSVYYVVCGLIWWCNG